jgi:hypothetical protein
VDGRAGKGAFPPSRFCNKIADKLSYKVALVKVRLHYLAKSTLDEFARRVFDKLASSKLSKSPFLLDEFARRANSSLKLETLLDIVNAT